MRPIIMGGTVILMKGGGQRGGKLLYLIISETVQDKDIVKPTMEYL